MDPDETLKNLRELVSAILDPIGQHPSIEDAEQLAAEFDYLDRWITRGGFLPQDWQEKKHD